MLTDEDRTREHHAAVDAFVAALHAAPEATVPFYPSWVVRQLGIHLAAVHTMGAIAIATAAQERPTVSPPVDDDASPEAVAAALRTAVDRLDQLLDDPPVDRVWSLLPDRPVKAWRRRMLMETTLHLWDATSATGPAAVPAHDVALDGLDEFLEVHGARSLRTAELTGSVLFDAGGAVWLVDLATAQVTLDPAVPDAGATLRGDPASLWLWCNRRAPLPAGLDIEDGDGSAAAFDDLLEGLSRPAA
jgi:uncharacterized protein (TIGR03083 family)